MQLTAEQQLRKFVEAPEAAILSSKALQDAYWMKTNEMGVYDLDRTDPVSKPQVHKAGTLKKNVRATGKSSPQELMAAVLSAGIDADAGGTK